MVKIGANKQHEQLKQFLDKKEGNSEYMHNAT